MKEELLALYEKHHAAYKAVLAAHPGENMDGPHLISPNQLYPKQPHRFMIIGQETRGWVSDVDDRPKQMAYYEEFNVGAIYRATPFWNVTRGVEQLLGNEPYSCAWSNISKFDHNNGRAYGEFATSIATVDYILSEEIAILKPTFCLFYTGPVFDSRIRGIFEGIKYEEVDGFNVRELARLKHPVLPEMSFRSYHPGYMHRRGLEKGFLQFVESVL